VGALPHHFRVRDIIEQAALSRRALEIHFQKALGRSICEELQRTRLTLAKQLLLETDLPVAKVADASGFSSLSYLSFSAKDGRNACRTPPRAAFPSSTFAVFDFREILPRTRSDKNCRISAHISRFVFCRFGL